MESAREHLVLDRASALAAERDETDLMDLPDDLQDALLEEAERLVEEQLETERARDLESRLGPRGAVRRAS